MIDERTDKLGPRRPLFDRARKVFVLLLLLLSRDSLSNESEKDQCRQPSKSIGERGHSLNLLLENIAESELREARVEFYHHRPILSRSGTWKDSPLIHAAFGPQVCADQRASA